MVEKTRTTESELHSQSRVRLDQFDSSIGLKRGAGKLKELSWYLIKVFFFLSALPFPSSFKVFLLKCFGAKVGNGVVIKPRVNIHFPWKLVIGNYVWIGEEVFILNFEPVVIGNNACISQRSFLCGGNHNFKVPSMPYRNGPITIKAGSWIGAGCFVGPNVVVGVDSVVTAGSVVTSPVAANGIYRGNPAVFIKHRW
ncbi:WcaF family extracellular polysaccharide biosynthesis acetyltransferase [Flavobacterium rhizosphaerae]|uniref:WcaF family extracellular polysaccharide biosynthesis acetyltransferase n=1 Tax=Flavobacterium rhizosphaerae TaxID=3163298 RepID=A0ABW8YXD3_9FLAO